jgi:hypothetical protein
MQRLEEMVRLQPYLDVLDQPVVDHQRAEKRRFRFDILREGRSRTCVGGPVDTEDFGHGAVLRQSDSRLQRPCGGKWGQSPVVPAKAGIPLSRLSTGKEFSHEGTKKKEGAKLTFLFVPFLFLRAFV